MSRAPGPPGTIVLSDISDSPVLSPYLPGGQDLVTGEDVTSRLQEALGSSSETETEGEMVPARDTGKKIVEIEAAFEEGHDGRVRTASSSAVAGSSQPKNYGGYEPP